MSCCEERKRSCISWSGSLDQNLRKQAFIYLFIFNLSWRCWFLCVYYCLKNRNNERALINRMKFHCHECHVTGFLASLTVLFYTSSEDRQLIQCLPGIHTCRWQHLPVLWAVGAGSRVSSVIRKLIIRGKIFPHLF